jgi:RNA-directed DNA polymerase
MEALSFVSTEDADMRAEMPETNGSGSARQARELTEGASNTPARKESSNPKSSSLMLAVVERENMRRALLRVERNKGTAGIDEMSVEDLRAYLKEHWPRLKEELLSGRYKPQPVRRVEIPKPGGKGVRKLGIPTVVDRLIQQALNQVLSPIFEAHFSPHSFGFRPGKSAHDAVKAAQKIVESGKRWVVDMDLEQFFDRVNHDILMSRLARRISDKLVLKLIRSYLEAGVLESGMAVASREGTPQGGPLSPLLSNVLLDDLDKELERRRHLFCRYADDCNVYVASKAAGERVLASLENFLGRRLKLKVNKAKSAVARPWQRKFLGYSMTWHKKPRLKVAKATVQRLKGDLKAVFRQGRGRNVGRLITEQLVPKLRGWITYFRLSEVKGIFGELDLWIKRRLRAILWRQWKRGKTRFTRLMSSGLGKERSRKSAGNGRGAWWNAQALHMTQAFPTAYFEKLGLVSLQAELARLNQGA